MMNIRELRIGNYLNYGDDIVEVSAIFKSHFNCERMSGISIGNNIQNHFKPINITEEELLMFGFTKMDGFDYYHNMWSLHGFMVDISDYLNVFVNWAEDNDGKYHSIICLENTYVHTLQNIYYTIIQKELVFNSERYNKKFL